MSAIDDILGMDWSDATYLGDGVYLRDATDYMGIPALAIRTDRGFNHHVIVFEGDVFGQLVRRGQDILTANALAREANTEGVRDITISAGIGIAGWYRARCQWCGTERPLNQLMERYGMLKCYWFCGNRTRPDLYDLPRSKAVWRQGTVGVGYVAYMPRSFIHRWDASRCDRCGRPCAYVPGHIGKLYWLAVCGGASCPSLPRPMVDA